MLFFACLLATDVTTITKVFRYRNLSEKLLHTIFATHSISECMSVAKPYTRMVLEVLNMIHHKNRFVLIENNE